MRVIMIGPNKQTVESLRVAALQSANSSGRPDFSGDNVFAATDLNGIASAIRKFG
jgi:hypothetical protein